MEISKKKQIVKNARLNFMEPNIQIYQHSNGVKKGKPKYITNKEADELIKSSTNYKKIYEGDVDKTFGQKHIKQKTIMFIKETK